MRPRTCRDYEVSELPVQKAGRKARPDAYGRGVGEYGQPVKCRIIDG